MSKKGPKDSVVYNQQLPYTIDQMTRRTDEQFGSCHLQEEVPSGGKLLSAINRAYSPYRSMKFVGAFVNDESRRRVTTPSGRMHLPLTFVAANTYSLDHHRNTSESVPHILRHLIISSPLYHSTNSKGDTEVLPTIPIGASVLPACAALTGNSLGYDFQQNSTERKVGLSFFTEQTNRLPPNLPSSNLDLSIQRTFEKHPLPPSHNVVAKGVNLGAMKPSHKQFSHCKLLLQSNSHNKFYDSVTETSDRFLGPNNILSSNHNNIKTRLVITPSPKKPSIKETNDWLDKCSKWYAFTSSEKGEEVPPSCVKFPYRIWNDAPLCMQPTLIAGYKVFGESANKLQKIEDLPVYLASLVAGIMVFRAAVNSSPTDPLGRALLDTCTKCNMSVISPFDEVLRSFFNLFGHHLLPSIDGKGHLMSAHIESTHFLLHIRSVKYKKSFFFEVPIYHPQSGELLSPAVILNQLISVVKGNSGVAAVMSMEIDLGDYRAGDINYIAGAALNEVTACTMLTRLQCNSNSEKIINSSLFNVLINLFDEDDDISKNYTLPSDSSLTNGGLGVCVNVTLSDFLLAFDAYACLDPIKCASRPSVNVNTFFHALEATLPNESDASMLSATSFVLNAANIIESLLIDMLHGGAMKEGTKGIFCPGEDVVGDGESPNGHLPLPSVSGTSELRLSVSSLFCDKKDVSENVTKEKVIDCRVSIPTQIIQRAMQQKKSLVVLVGWRMQGTLQPFPLHFQFFS